MAIAELLEATVRGDIALFVGAGISIGAGLPDWLSLLRPLAETLGIDLPTDPTNVSAQKLLSIAQMWENTRGRNALLSYVRDRLDGIAMSSSIIHKFIAKLPIKVIFTTNYDRLLEHAYWSQNRAIHLSVVESDLAFWHENEAQLIKLCGTIDRPESIVITARDFNTYFATHGRLAERLRTTMESKVLLIVGYSMQDPFFNQLWDTTGLHFGPLRRKAFAVVFEPTLLEVEDLGHRGVEAISVSVSNQPRTDALQSWLSSMWGM